MKQYLVTGGAGFIGSHFVEYFMDHNPQDRIVTLDALTYAGTLENLERVERYHRTRHDFVHGNICNKELVEYLFEQYQFDGVVHFAAESHVDRSIADATDFIQTNVQGTHTLLEMARQALEKSPKDFRFVLISTDEVYGSLSREDQCPFTEEHPLLPNNPYSASKAGADMLVRAYRQTYGFPAVTLRGSNNYGPRQHKEKLVPKVIAKALAQASIPIYGDGKQTRDWLYVRDFADAIYRVLIGHPTQRVYNVGGSQPLENLAMVTRLIQGVGASASLITFTEDRLGHDEKYLLDHSLFSKEFGWQPTTSLEQGLKATVAYAQEKSAR